MAASFRSDSFVGPNTVPQQQPTLSLAANSGPVSVCASISHQVCRGHCSRQRIDRPCAAAFDVCFADDAESRSSRSRAVRWGDGRSRRLGSGTGGAGWAWVVCDLASPQSISAYAGRELSRMKMGQGHPHFSKSFSQVTRAWVRAGMMPWAVAVGRQCSAMQDSAAMLAER